MDLYKMYIVATIIGILLLSFVIKSYLIEREIREFEKQNKEQRP